MSSFSSARHTILVAAIAVMLPAAAAIAAPPNVNGIKINERVGNGISGSTLTVNSSNSNPGTVSIDDRAFNQAGTNRHDALWSVNGGMSAAQFSITNGFTMSGIFNLTAGANSPRKEVGLEIIGNPTGRALFIINSDAGEIVAFGGGMPFKSFGNNGGGNGYTPGQSILLGMTYTPGTDGNKGTLEYFIDRDPTGPAGYDTSGPLMITNVEGGPVNYQIGAYAQFNANAAGFATDFGNASITDFQVSVTPEPASMAAIAAAGLAVMGRRRKA